jgi:hypothetical protein
MQLVELHRFVELNQIAALLLLSLLHNDLVLLPQLNLLFDPQTVALLDLCLYPLLQGLSLRLLSRLELVEG